MKKSVFKNYFMELGFTSSPTSVSHFLAKDDRHANAIANKMFCNIRSCVSVLCINPEGDVILSIGF